MTAILNWNRAATSADPAPGVAEAMIEGLHAVDPARGAGLASARREQVRDAAARLFGWSAPERVVFTSGATYGLNQAVRAIPEGAFVVASELEHNAALRPLEAARAAGRLELSFARFDPSGMVQLPELEAAFAARGEREAWLFLALASNVLGTLQPVEEIASWCQARGVHLVLDLSQGAGQVPIALDRWKPRFAAVAAHKGLHGPQGIGILFVDADAPLAPLVHGGTGRHGEQLDPPRALPGCLEAGTPNMPGIYGLGAALSWRLEHPADLTAAREALAWVETGLRADPRVQVLPREAPPWEQRLPVLSFVAPGIPSAVLAAELAQQGILVRAGLMCAALASQAAGVTEAEGVVRLSPPESTQMEDAERVLAAILQTLSLFAPAS